MRRALTYAAVVVVTATLAAGCDSGGSDQAAAPTPVPSTAPASTPTTAPPSTEPAPTASPSPKPTASPKPQKLKAGVKGARVVALQQRLTDLGYWNGKADGTFGGQTTQAVYALQKAASLTRDGVVGPKTQKALDQGVRPKAKSTKGRVIEINLKRQLLMVVDDGTISQVFNTSTGSMEHYEQKGQTYLADTPSGKFRVSRQIDGWRHAPLGLLWRPKYFNGGIAIHGSPSIPGYAASHGCARVSNAAINWIWATGKLPLTTKVWVYRS